MISALALHSASAAITYKLAYTENFDGKKLNSKLWQRIGPGHPDWCRNMSYRADLVTQKNGIVSIRGIKNDGKDPSDTRAVLTGGIMTRDLFAMKYGKVEFRMKLEDHQKGAWPAVWMMPQNQPLGWPNDGEIDIVERLNGDAFTYQTVHFGNGSAADLTHGGRGTIKNGDWNVYALEWTPNEIVWLINGKETFRHVRGANDDSLKYPWTTPFYLMIDMQLGGRWVGGVNEATLPVTMHVDWVKFYHAYDGKKRLSSFTRKKYDMISEGR